MKRSNLKGGEKLVLEGETYRLFKDSKKVGPLMRTGYSIYRSTRKQLRLVGFVWQNPYLYWFCSSGYGLTNPPSFYTRTEAVKAELQNG